MPDQLEPWKYNDGEKEPEPDTDTLRWETLNPQSGLEAWDALYHFADKDLAVELYTTERVAYGIGGYVDPYWFPGERKEFERASAVWHALLTTLTSKLITRLLAGELEARGYSSHSSLDGPRVVIGADRWRDLTLDIRHSSATGPGLAITQILIFLMKDDQPPVASPKRKAYPAKLLREWYCNYVKECQSSGRIPSRDDDLRDARAAFGEGVPRQAVRELRIQYAPSPWKRRGRRLASSCPRQSEAARQTGR
ncbi:hypothetical protein [Rubellimicrobium arenae]|uniref:hypothetical protein n=1 Tax=Rubellimicrobium arenae TaxID=2817372 RepID=UPI001B30DEBA|nr:hypothetical protein [Rubellimicrobium arenae]